MVTFPSLIWKKIAFFKLILTQNLWIFSLLSRIIDYKKYCHQKNSRQSFSPVNNYFYFKRRRRRRLSLSIDIASYLTCELNLSWLSKLWCKIHIYLFILLSWRYFFRANTMHPVFSKKWKQKKILKLNFRSFLFMYSKYIEKTKTHKMMQGHSFNFTIFLALSL